MKLVLKNIIFSLFIFQSIAVFSQDCTEYHIDHCRWADRSFLYSRQSKSAAFTPGMKSEFNIVVYDGEEYYISVAGHKKLGDIRLRLIEDDKDKIVLYDNQHFNYEDYFYFKNSLTKKLIVQIISEVSDEDKSNDERYCIGVLIEFRKTKFEKETEKLGF